VGGLPTNRTVNGFAIDPANPRIMFVAMRDGLFKSTDAGVSWKRIGNKLKHLIAVILNPKRPKEMYVSTIDGTIFLSVDAGIKWTRQQ
jgi:photosystem II stability/assembly factor-like uncharacterized protein